MVEAEVAVTCTATSRQRPLSHGHTAQSILKDLSGDLHGAYLASAGATLLGQQCEPLSGRIAHGHFGMPHPARIGWPSWTQTLPGLEAGLYGRDDIGQPSGTERAPTRVRHLAHNRCAADRRQLCRCFLPYSLPQLLAFRLLSRWGSFQREFAST